MSSNHTEVREALYHLNMKTKEVAELDCQAVGNALFGLRGMSSTHVEVRDVLQTFSTKIRQMRGKDFTEDQIIVCKLFCEISTLYKHLISYNRWLSVDLRG